MSVEGGQRGVDRWRAAVTPALEVLGLTDAGEVLLAPLYGLVPAQRGAESARATAGPASLEPIYPSKLVTALERDGLVARRQVHGMHAPSASRSASAA